VTTARPGAPFPAGSATASAAAAPAPFPPVRLMYGTAWKEERTERLVRLALEAGFRAIDTANQRKHYFEAGVGAALGAAVADGLVTRAELFLQTKFTFRDGQDHRLPYDARAPVEDQVAQSFQSSLEHLGTDYLDSYVLHGPSVGRGLAPADHSAWRAMEELQRSGRTRYLGVSNVTREQLELLLGVATVPPAFVQNRCYARTGWNRDVRALCGQNGIVYQGFSLLTANSRELSLPALVRIAARAQATPAELVFRMAAGLGMLPLTGTSSPEHMRQDLRALDLALDPDDLSALERLAG
jgi:diketogulonate reductase-like aldo/keto reductase